ncbi:hypothetical protein D3C71_1657270 [compost metagenome]
MLAWRSPVTVSEIVAGVLDDRVLVCCFSLAPETSMLTVISVGDVVVTVSSAVAPRAYAD